MTQRKLMLASISAVVLLAIGAGYYFWSQRPSVVPEEIAKSPMTKFTGDVKAIVADKITLHGMIAAPAGTRLAREYAAPRDFDFLTDATTQFMKSVTRFPSWKEMEAIGGSFRLEDLPREEASGSSADLLASFAEGRVYVEADFGDDLTKYPNPIATRVTYRIYTIPRETSASAND